MMIIDTDLAFARALDAPLALHLREILVTRFDQLGGDIQDHARFLVVEPPDTLAAVEAAIGFPLTIDDAPTWDVARLHWGRLVELVLNLSDDGPADVVLVLASNGLDADLTHLLQRHGALAPDHEPHSNA